MSSVPDWVQCGGQSWYCGTAPTATASLSAQYGSNSPQRDDASTRGEIELGPENLSYTVASQPGLAFMVIHTPRWL